MVNVAGLAPIMVKCAEQLSKQWWWLFIAEITAVKFAKWSCYFLQFQYTVNQSRNCDSRYRGKFLFKGAS